MFHLQPFGQTAKAEEIFQFASVCVRTVFNGGCVEFPYRVGSRTGMHQIESTVRSGWPQVALRCAVTKNTCKRTGSMLTSV